MTVHDDTSPTVELPHGRRSSGPQPSGVEYHRVLADGRRRIGRGVAAIALLVIGAVGLGFVTAEIAAVLDTQMGRSNPTSGGTDITPLYQAGNMAALALLIPWSMCVQRWLYGVRGATLHSVTGRFRFDLLGRAIVLVGPLWVVVIVLSTAVPGQVPWSSADLVAMLLVTVLLTPLQSAGEEYGLRGLVFRVAGSWTRGPRAGLVLGIVVSSVVFVSLHLSPDLWLNFYYFAPALSFALITWRTGGIEIAIVVHALNNTLLFLFDTVLHSDFPSLQERSAGGGSALLLIPAAGLVVVTAVVWVATRRTGPVRAGPAVEARPDGH
jgi:membrane protease YdiL (CAAX protease family)